MRMENEIINKIKEYECYKTGSFLLKSGNLSSYYFDLRPLISYPNIIASICSLIYNKINMYNNIRICGLPYAGIPYASAMSILHNIPLLLLRKEQKQHGTKKMIEGNYNIGDNIVIIDDILTTGSSILDSLEYLNTFKIKKIVVIIDRMEGGREKLENMGFEVESLYTIDDFI